MRVSDRLSDFLFPTEEKKPLFLSRVFKRCEYSFNGASSQLADIHSQYGLQVLYTRILSLDSAPSLTFRSKLSVTRIGQGSEFGTILAGKYKERQYTVWLPPAAAKVCFDGHHRIEGSKLFVPDHQWSFQPDFQLTVLKPRYQGEISVIPCVVFEDPDGQYFQEISTLSGVERRLYRKSDWFYAKRPADFWNYMINGSLYDPRSKESVDKRFKCQQCAYSWWNYFGFLSKETGKKVYSAMQDEIAFSTLLDMSANGQWEHGFWSDEIETHARFQLDGLHLLTSQYHKTAEPMWLEAAERGMNFIFKYLTEKLDDGSVWFLHDTIEKSRGHHFQSTLFGKSSANTLCINTHVQAMTVLYRMQCAFINKEIHAETFEKASRALRRVLDYQTGELFYRPLNYWVRKYSKKRSRAKSKWQRVWIGLEGRLIRSIYWTVRRQFPRIAQSDGFVERDLTHSFAPHKYHTTNMKDFLTLYQLKPLPWLRPYIEKGLDFIWKFLDQFGLKHALASSPYHMEIIDILDLSDRLIAPVPPDKIEFIKQTIFEVTGGYSLDHYASELVRGDLYPNIDSCL